MKTRGFLISTLGAGICGGSMAAAASTAPFTVVDSIEMTRLTDPDASALTFFKPIFKISPDGSKLAFVTLKGNLNTGRNEYSLSVLKITEVLQFVRNKGSAHRLSQDVVARMEAGTYQDSSDHAIDAPRWLGDSRRVAFIGRDAKELRQVYIVDTQTHALRKLTDHPHDVDQFDISQNGEVVLYAARIPPDWNMRNAHGYVVSSDWMQDLARNDPRDATPEIHYFLAHASSNRITPIETPPGIMARVISLSPNGRWGVVFAQAQGLPPQWRRYEPLKNWAGPDPRPDDAAFGSVSPWLGQFLLVDAASGAARPLVDAPAQLGAVVKALWSQDSREVAVLRTFLPLEKMNPTDLESRQKTQCIVSVDVGTGAASCVTSVAADSRITGMERLSDDSIVVTEESEDWKRKAKRRFQRGGDSWNEVEASSKEGAVQFFVRQDLNTPPDIVAMDTRTRRQAVITDLNPRFLHRTMSRAVEYRWNDRKGHRFVGGLVYPPGFRLGQRYPLVLQTSPYGFIADLFLVDGFGWITSASAARPLASRGIVVLQMPAASGIGDGSARPQSNYAWQEEGEAPRFTAMMEAAIDALSADGMTDREKTGVIGFSRTCLHVSHALVFSAYPLAAATIADGLAATPFAQSMFYGIPPPAGMLEFEQDSVMGAPFWGAGVNTWVGRSPYFHLDRLHTPLRLEAYGVGIPAYWDTFALLKRQRRPVELIHIPRGHHVLITPYSRYRSQQGNVDWFAFWLKGEERREPILAASETAESLAEQYRNWRVLRDQNSLVQNEVRPSGSWQVGINDPVATSSATSH